MGDILVSGLGVQVYGVVCVSLGQEASEVIRVGSIVQGVELRAGSVPTVRGIYVYVHTYNIVFWCELDGRRDEHRI